MERGAGGQPVHVDERHGGRLDDDDAGRRVAVGGAGAERGYAAGVPAWLAKRRTGRHARSSPLSRCHPVLERDGGTLAVLGECGWGDDAGAVAGADVRQWYRPSAALAGDRGTGSDPRAVPAACFRIRLIFSRLLKNARIHAPVPKVIDGDLIDSQLLLSAIFTFHKALT
jgi:hypothetical protein